MLFPPARDPALDPAPSPPHWPALRKPWRQIAAIVAIATVFAWLSPFWPRGIATVALWIGTSVTIAFFANKGANRLLFAPILALIFPAAIVGNAAAAHLLFGVCFQD